MFKSKINEQFCSFRCVPKSPIFFKNMITYFYFFLPINLLHGKAEIYGYRFGRAAYLTDFSEVPEDSMSQLRDLDILFLDALRHRPHPTHSNVENSLRLVELLRPKQAFFTHISHDLGHEETNASLPPHVRLAYDGLKLEFEIY